MGQQCCDGRTCSQATLGCDKGTKLCATCGGAGQPCCANSACTGALRCTSDHCQQ
jgi:hypothetical protein